MAPSWGTSCFLSSRRILLTVSTSGDRPPCTQSTAPPGEAVEEDGRDDADVPGGPGAVATVGDDGGDVA